MDVKKVIMTKLVTEFLQEKKYRKLNELVDTVHVADIAEIIEKLKKTDRESLYNWLGVEKLAEVMVELSNDYHEEIISTIDTSKLKLILEDMSNDDIADIFGEFSKDEVQMLMKLLDEEEREEVEKLISHESDTAGGLMTTDYFSVETGTTIKESISMIKKYGEDAELVYYIYVVENEKLIGIASLRELITNNQGILIDKIMEKNILSVQAETDQEEVAKKISKYDLLAIPVLDENEKMLGIITVDDIIDVIEEEATEDIYAMAGLTEEEVEDDISILRAVKLRIPWLFISFVGEIISANFLSKFDAVLKEVVALAFFIPLIMAMGGNSGSQSSAVMVRKIALGEAEPEKLKKMIFKESMAGMLIGFLAGISILTVATFWQNDVKLGLTIGASLFIAITFAAISGTLFPLLFNKFKVDPAVASGPMITTLNDIGGIIIYFTIANFLFNLQGVG